MRRVVIIGSGRTGRGMFGEMFYLEGGFDLVFADIDSELIGALREQGYYTVEKKNLLTGKVTKTRVDKFHAIDVKRDHEEYIDFLVKSELVATAVFPESFDVVASDLAEMVSLRTSRNVVEPVAVLLGGNYVGLKARFDMAITTRLAGSERDYYDKYVTLITTKANRKVVYPVAFGEDALALTGDDKSVLQVDDAFRFEPGWGMPKFFEPVESCELSMIKKIWNENLLHCSLGFMGAYAGYETIGQIASNRRAWELAKYAWLEGRRALELEYGMPMPSESEIRETFNKFTSPYLSDSISRIVRQPIRKLQPNDRFLGPAFLCMKHGINPYFILHAASYGFCYMDENEPQSMQIADAVRKDGIESAVATVCGLDVRDEQSRFARDMIVAGIREITAGDSEVIMQVA